MNQNHFYEKALSRAEVGFLRLKRLGIMYHIPIPKKIKIFKQFLHPKLEYGLGLMTNHLARSRTMDDKIHRVLCWT